MRSIPAAPTALALFVLLAPLAAPAAEVHCPPTLTVTAQPEAVPGWTAYPATTPHMLAGITLTEGSQAAKTASPATLAPDREHARGRRMVLNWALDPYRTENLFLTCRYAGTAATVAIDLPRTVRRCEIVLEYDRKTGVAENPTSPPPMACR